MSLITYIPVGLLILAAVMFALAVALDENSDLGATLGIGSMIVAVVAVVVLMVWGGANIFYRMQSDECERFGTETGLETKMIRYNSVDFDCLVRAESGWVTKGNYWNSER